MFLTIPTVLFVIIADQVQQQGKLAIYELIAEESFFCYWEKFGSIAFDTSQKAMLTSCLLKNPNPQAENKYINCCFSFTIRRDAYDM